MNQDQPAVHGDPGIMGLQQVERLCSPVRVLLDECLPHHPKRDLAGHHVPHCRRDGRGSTKNGDLL